MSETPDHETSLVHTGRFYAEIRSESGEAGGQVRRMGRLLFCLGYARITALYMSVTDAGMCFHHLGRIGWLIFPHKLLLWEDHVPACL